jgi:hypothetical protein
VATNPGRFILIGSDAFILILRDASQAAKRPLACAVIDV